MASLAKKLQSMLHNPYADDNLNFFSLESKDKGAEHGFACQLCQRLSRSCIFLGGSIVFLEGVWFSMVDYSSEPYDSAASYKVRMLCLGADAVIACMGALLLVAGACQRRCKVRTSPRVLELIVLVCMLMALAAAPFTEAGYMASFTGDLDVAETNPVCGAWFALFIDCAVTAVSMMPIRWSSVWLLHLVALVWYPIALYIKPHGTPITIEATSCTLTVLGMCAAFGKRNMEVQEKRLHFSVITERTLRAESEFRLTQVSPLASMASAGAASNTGSRASRTAPSNTSFETAQVFYLNTSSPTSAEQHLQIIKDRAMHEQWGISQDDLMIFPSAVLGEGACGVVVEGEMCGSPVAVKIPNGSLLSNDVQPLAGLAAELRILRKVRHPNIVLFYGAVVAPHEVQMAIVLERVFGPDLGNFVRTSMYDGKMMSDTDMYRLLCGIALALRYLHGQKPRIVHADLKPSNIVVELVNGAPPCAKLVDFGLSRVLSGRVRAFGGTVAWVAPEVVHGDCVPTIAVDVFGFGRLAHFITTGKAPFKDWQRQGIMLALASGDLKVPDLPGAASTFAEAFWKIGSLCVSADPYERPHILQVATALQSMAIRDDASAGMRDVARTLWGRGLNDGSLKVGRTLSADQAVPWLSVVCKLREAKVEQGEERQGRGEEDGFGGGGGSAEEARSRGAPGGASGRKDVIASVDAALCESLSSSGSSRNTLRGRDGASKLPRIAESHGGENPSSIGHDADSVSFAQSSGVGVSIGQRAKHGRGESDASKSCSLDGSSTGAAASPASNYHHDVRAEGGQEGPGVSAPRGRLAL